MIYIEDATDSTTKKLLRLTKFSKVAGYKINIQKSVVFLYNNKTTEREKRMEWMQRAKLQKRDQKA